MSIGQTLKQVQADVNRFGKVEPQQISLLLDALIEMDKRLTELEQRTDSPTKGLS
jgi:hypothetical protein